MNNENLTLRKVAHLALPVLISEFLEEALIVTDSILLSYKPSIYLASVGIIDAILLIVLAYGVALNDSYQNYFARYGERDLMKVIGIFKNGWKNFTISGCLASLIVIILYLLLKFIPYTNDIIVTVGQSIWFIIPLAILSYISMWLNSFLIGLRHYRFLATISILCVVINGITGYFLLFKVSIPLNPTAVILTTSSLAELLAIILMGIFILQKYAPHKLTIRARHQRLLTQTFYFASFYPALSEIGFHIGSLVLFVFCSYFFPQSQVALLTLIFSYWGLLQVPVDGLQEISLNYFAAIHSKKKLDNFSCGSSLLIRFSRLCCAALFFIVVLTDSFINEISIYKYGGTLIVFLISLSACGTEILNTSLIVRLKNDSYMVSKIIFGVISCSLILIGRFVLKIDNVFIILIPFLLAQLIENGYVSLKAKALWK